MSLKAYIMSPLAGLSGANMSQYRAPRFLNKLRFLVQTQLCLFARKQQYTTMNVKLEKNPNKTTYTTAAIIGIVVILSSVDVGDLRCSIHGDDAIFTHTI